eukprot:TRINITY_DN20244_c0_g1_i1.p1 TRINITY_DN20244_c0_g1~~TRINITY_DN20244_c0_g1_i1.p1  ORF type:complete len:199 (+),score=67.44 TRINITY_DN20244_c0_g1_i1:77-598(+)
MQGRAALAALLFYCAAAAAGEGGVGVDEDTCTDPAGCTVQEPEAAPGDTKVCGKGDCERLLAELATLDTPAPLDQAALRKVFETMLRGLPCMQPRLRCASWAPEALPSMLAAAGKNKGALKFSDAKSFFERRVNAPMSQVLRVRPGSDVHFTGAVSDSDGGMMFEVIPHDLAL